MSRSYKKHPYFTDGRNGRKIKKRYANKTVRNYNKKIAKGNAFKHLYCSWNIHDYISRWTWEEAKFEHEHNNEYPTLKECYKYWSKYYKRK